MIPRTCDEYFCAVAAETARMSWPGAMSRGKAPVVVGETKKTVNTYFVTVFPLSQLWGAAVDVAKDFETWHYRRVWELGRFMKSHVCPPNDPKSVAAKFINTFLHQLQKYEPCRVLWPVLHLPLDKRIFRSLRGTESHALLPVRPLLSLSPYRLPYRRHLDIQRQLPEFMAELNSRAHAAFQFRARIELNLLWVAENRGTI